MIHKLSFSLIELMMALAITTILCALCIPHFTHQNDYLVRQDLEKLSVIIMLLQQQAIASGQVKNLFFDIDNNCYWYDKKDGKAVFTLSANCSFGYLIGALGPPGDPKTPIKQAISFSVTEPKNSYPSIKILPNGNSSHGTIYIIDKTNRLMGALTCPLSQVFYIRKYLYKPPRWHVLTN